MNNSSPVDIAALIVGILALLIAYFTAPKDRLKEGFNTAKSVLLDLLLFGLPIAVITLYYLYEPIGKPFVIVVGTNFLYLSLLIMLYKSRRDLGGINNRIQDRNSYQSDMNLEYFKFVNDNKVAWARIVMKLFMNDFITKEEMDELLKAQDYRIDEIMKKLNNIP